VHVPRDVSGELLCSRLARLGYVKVRQRGSHRTMTTQRNGRHSLHIPIHNPIKVGMLAAILNAAANHLGLNAEELLRELEL
jgi:predicted RNA binding protein YcfA (HicA-like mRNA interferase family)